MNNQIKRIQIALLLVTAQITSAQQQQKITGVITDVQTAQPIQGSNINVKGTPLGATSAKNGEYFLNIPLNTTLLVSAPGYKTKEIKVTPNPLNNTLNIQLDFDINELADVKVTTMNQKQSDTQKVLKNVMPVTIITAKQIENRAGNLNEFLARQAGVQIRMSGGLGSESRISVRGLEGKRVQIFLDGNPLNTPDGSLGINDLPVQVIERIEIYKGSVPAYLGGDGLGSAVNVIFKHRNISYIDASVSRQSYNTQLISAIAKKTFDKPGIEVAGGVFDSRSDNNYTMQSPYQPGLKVKRDHDQYHSLLAGSSIRFHKLWFDEIEIEGASAFNKREVQGIQQNIQSAQSQSSSYVGIINLDKKKFVSSKLNLKYNFIYAMFNVKFTDTSSYNYQWDGSKIPSLTGKGELGIGPNQSRNLQQDIRQRLNLDYKFNESFVLNLNSTSRFAKVNPQDNLGNAYAGKNLYNYPGNLKNAITGLTLEIHSYDDNLLISGALKNYYNSITGYNTSIYANNSSPDKLQKHTNELAYNVGLRYNFTPTLLIKASHEKGIRLPNNAELFGDGILITPNTALKPEKANNNNIGLAYDFTTSQEKRLQIDANAFYMQVSQLIQLSGNGLSLGYVNYAKARIMGVDLDAKYDITNNLYASFNATYQKLTDVNRFIPGTQNVPNPTFNLTIPNTPQFFANWSLEFHKTDLVGKNFKTRIIYDGSFTDTYNYGFDISIYDKFIIPSFLTHTLSIEQSFMSGKYTFTAECNNISNRIIINNYNQPLPGRTFRIKLRYLILGNSKAHHH